MEKPRSRAIIDNGAGLRLFVKVYKNNVKVEYAKAEQIYRASLKGRCFVTPRPLHVVPEHGLILWEYLPGLVNLRAFLLKTKKPKRDGQKLHAKILNTCGQALATIHSCLNLGGSPRIQKFSMESTKNWLALHHHVLNILEQSPVRYLHGDFGCANLFISSSGGGDPRIVVLDSSPNLFLYDDVASSIFGTIYLDLASFIASLSSKPSFYYYFKKDILFFAEEFLRGYEEIASYSIDRPTALACTAEILLKYGKYQKMRVSRSSMSAWWVFKFRGLSARRLLETATQEMPIAKNW